MIHRKEKQTKVALRDDEYLQSLHEEDSSEEDENQGEQFTEEAKSTTALRRHYDPLIYGPEHLEESKRLQFKKTISMAYKKNKYGTVENMKFGSREIDKNGHVKYKFFKCIPPEVPILDLKTSVYSVLDAFVRISRNETPQKTKMALLEDDGVQKLLQEKEACSNQFLDMRVPVPAHNVNTFRANCQHSFSTQSIISSFL